MFQKPTLQELQALEGTQVSHSRSPAGNWMELTLEKIEHGKATISLAIRPEMANPYGHIHGGMMSLVIDECIGWAVVSLVAEQNYTSMNLAVDFLYAAAVGERITATATIIRHGKKIINVDSQVYNNRQQLLAKASSNLIATGMNIVDKL